MATLNGTVAPVSLGEGYAVRAPGFRGTADLKRPAAPGGRARGGQDSTDALEAAFAATGMTTQREIELQIQPAPAAPAGRMRSAAGQDAVELTIPPINDDYHAFVLACDESGVMTWQLPVAETGTSAPVRGGGRGLRFIVPTPRAEAPPAGRTRSLVSAVGRKLLKVVVYPVLDPIVGAVADALASRWEARSRPYGVRDFTPDNATLPQGRPLDAAAWSGLAQGQALLFIHGTFSTAHGAFSQLPRATFEKLHARYGGRVFAFNHYTLSQDPAENVRWLLQTIPRDVRLSLDVICHSRGGLVARTLAERPSTFGLDTGAISVGKVVLAGVPNNGTLLANPDHMVKMIDRMTTALNLFPTGPVSETMEAVLTAVKVIGHGALKSLTGLAAMRPDGDFVRALNHGTAPKNDKYYGIAANFEAARRGLRSLVSAAADGVMDVVFENDANDLVVPEAGVYGDNGCALFPIDDARLLRLPDSAAVSHTTLFGNPEVSDRIVRWLDC